MALFKNKTALFTTTDKNYFEKAIQTFRTYQTYNPDAFDFFIICSSVSENQIELAKSLSINVIQIDLSETFKIESNWPYPSECFWVFKGPDILLKRGYSHSMYVDADTVCVSSLDLSWLDDSFVVAGAKRMDISHWKEIKSVNFLIKVEKNFKLLKEAIPEMTNGEVVDINSGVIFFNNVKWDYYKMYRRSVNLFKRAKLAGVPRKGDDSLLSLLQTTTPTHFYKILDPVWNYYYERANSNPKIDFSLIKILHLSSVKPWISIGDIKKIRNHNIKKGIMIWKKQDIEFKMKKFKPSHNLWWYRSTREYNFGDEITPWLINKMFGFSQSTPCDSRANNVLLAVGSIMRLSSRNTEVWGPGIRNIDQMDFKRAKKVHAVRGLFTRQRLLELKHECPEVYGDPGLLLPNYYNPTGIEKKYRIGFIPHIVDYAFVKQRFTNNPDVLIINLKTNNIESVVDQILQCETILSTSLHGIITAVAYDVPVRWYKVSDKINGDDIKFYDFFSSLDHSVFSKFDRKNFRSHDEKYNPLRFDENHTINDLINSTYLYDKTDFNQYRLIKACPFHMIEINE